MAQASTTSEVMSRQQADETNCSRSIHHDIVIVGGGTAGITVAARLLKGSGRHRDVAVIDPATRHYFQPAFTLVGAGACSMESTYRDEEKVIPKHASWIQEAVDSICPEENYVTTREGTRVHYDWLVVAPGLQINWNQVPGLSESIGKYGVCSNYSFETVETTWKTLQATKSGTAIFTHPPGAVKCGGAPQKICYLADDFFRRQGVRGAIRIVFSAAMPHIFAVEKYRNVLNKVVARKEIETHFREELIEVRGPEQVARFRNLETGEECERTFAMLHVTPPMGPPDVIAKSPLADEKGWTDVDKYSLQHQRFANVFSLGDASNLPTSKTGAAIRKQAPVLVENLLAAKDGKPLTARYDGYTSCPLVTGYGKLVLAEFDYEQKTQETFPFDQGKERWSMYFFKRHVLPKLYWWGMLKGRG